jgi:excisionase family DNA binding protein
MTSHCNDGGCNMLTPEEISKDLKVHLRTVYRWIDSGKLTALKIQGIVRIREDDYRKFTHRADKSKN